MTTAPQNEPISSIDFNEDKESLLGLIEALVLASPNPVSSSNVVEILAMAHIALSEDVVSDVFKDLIARYSAEINPKSGIEIVQMAGGIAFRTKSRYGQFVRSLFKEKPQKLGTSQLEVLSIVSYRQPITRAEIEEIRGVDCSGSMRKLLNLKLIKILGKSNAMGRPLLYGTTKEFLEFFGLNSLHDLPTLREYEELNRSETEKELELKLSPDSMRILDLFEGHDTTKDKYEERERQSKEALESLDKALHHVANVAEKLDKQANTSN